MMPADSPQLAFGKYHGAGNDFVCIDERRGGFLHRLTAFAKTDPAPYIAALCDRHRGVGADGLILLRADASAPDGLGLEMVYFNSDGAPSSFCGNGSRCFLAFALDLGLLGEPNHGRLPNAVDFEANDGRHRGTVLARGDYEVTMRIEGGVVRLSDDDDRVETGSPHFVRWCGVLPQGDIAAAARVIRYGEAFAKTGINVNYVTQVGVDPLLLAIRTYERGVEAETLACGTGVTAAALSFAERRQLTGHQVIGVRALGGELAVAFERRPDGSVRDVRLRGPAVRAFGGEISWDHVLAAGRND